MSGLSNQTRVELLESHFRQKGLNLYRTIGQQISNPYVGLAEFVANSWDSGATEVHIILENDLLSIIDNGSGMGSDGIDSFLRVGGSDKPNMHVTPNNRPQMGKFNLATKMLYSFAKSYEVITTQNGQVRRFMEYTDDLDSGKPIHTQLSYDADKPNGTQITMHELKIGQDFNIQKLQEHLSWVFAPPAKGDSFNIYVNGELVINKVIENAALYKFHAEIAGVGPVDMDIYYVPSSRIRQQHGVCLYINNRAYGGGAIMDPHELSDISIYFPRRIIAQIHVLTHSLDDLVLANRDVIKEGDPRLNQIKEAVKGYLKTVKHDINSEREYRNLRLPPGKNLQPEFHRLEALLQQHSSKLPFPHTGINYTIHLSGSGDQQQLASASPQDGVIKIHTGNPYYALVASSPRRTKAGLFPLLLTAVVEALSFPETKNMQKFFRNRCAVARILSQGKNNPLHQYGGSSKKEPVQSLCWARLYGYDELPSLTGLTFPTIHRLIESHAFVPVTDDHNQGGPSTSQHRFDAKSINNIRTLTEGYVPLIAVLGDMQDILSSRVQCMEQSVGNKLDNMPFYPSFVRQIGKGHKSYWINANNISDWNKYYKSSLYSLWSKKVIQIGAECCTDFFITASGLAKMYETPIKTINELLMSCNGIQTLTDSESEGIIAYNVSDFVDLIGKKPDFVRNEQFVWLAK